MEVKYLLVITFFVADTWLPLSVDSINVHFSGTKNEHPGLKVQGEHKNVNPSCQNGKLFYLNKL